MDAALIFPLVALVGFGLPIGLIIFFVSGRNSARRAAQAGVFQQIAMQWGGQYFPGTGAFGGNRVIIPRPYTQITLETALLSVMNAMGSPYHSDGGTFTHARAQFAGGNGPGAKCAPSGAQQVPVFAGIPSISAIPGDAMLFCNPTEVIIVMPGSVSDANVLGAAVHFVHAVAERVASVAQQPMMHQQPMMYPPR